MIIQLNFEDPNPKIIPPEEIVEFLKKIKAKALVVFARDGWGRAYYKSKIYPSISEDFLERLYDLCKKNNIELIAMVCHTSNKFLFEKYGWAQVNERGEVLKLDSIETLEWPLMCLNSPFKEVILKEVEEVKDLCDGIMLDSFRYLECFCNFCKEEYKRRFGRELKKDLRSYLWRFEIILERIKEIKKRTKKLIYNSHPAGWDWKFNTIVEEGRDFIDVVFAECSETDFEPPGFLIEMTKLTRALFKKEVWTSRNVFHNFMTTFNSPLEVKIGFLEILFSGGKPVITIFSSSFDNLDFLEELSEIEDKVKEFLKWDEIKEVGIVFSNKTKDLFYRENIEDYILEVRGFFYSFLNMHYHVDFISEKDFDIEDYKVVILPNKRYLKEKEIRKIERFEGIVLATYLTSFLGRDFLLSDCFGARFKGINKRWCYCNKIPFEGGFVEVEPTGEKLFEVYEGKYEFGYEYVLGVSPPPIGSLKSFVTKNKIIYVPFKLGTNLFLYGFKEQYDLLKKLIEVEREIKIDAPETVRVIARRKGDEIAIFLINETFNQRIFSVKKKARFLKEGKFSCNVVREVIPVKVRIFGLKKCYLLSKGIEISGDPIEFTLKDFEVVLHSS